MVKNKPLNKLHTALNLKKLPFFIIIANG